jgi:hypothetical protein
MREDGERPRTSNSRAPEAAEFVPLNGFHGNFHHHVVAVGSHPPNRFARMYRHDGGIAPTKA